MSNTRKRIKTVPVSKAFREMQDDWLASKRAWEKHGYLNTPAVVDYTLLDVFHQGYLAGKRAKGRKKT